MSEEMRELVYTVPRISCGSCRALVTEELEELESVDVVEVDLESKRVIVRGPGLADGEIRAALVEIGYEPAAV